MKRVGILGGGQLGQLLGEALRELGARPRYYDPDPDAPAARQFEGTVTAPWTDGVKLAEFIGSVDVVTYEFENVDASGLRALAAGAPLAILPSLAVLETAQHRVREKEFLRGAGLPTVPFRTARSSSELEAAARALGFPVIVKSAAGGYDGKGQYFARTEADLLGPTGEVVVEEPLALETELSCIVARAASGEEAVFPVFENLHADHILDRTVVPARVRAEVCAEAQALAVTAARALDVVGLLTVEFFVGESRAGGRRLFVNELAPRPHNSGHVTREACSFSQYDALARVLTGVPLGAPRLVSDGAFCMGNLLGDVWLAQGRNGDELDLRAWAHHPEVVGVTLYGKRGARPKRKMGHFVVHAPDGERALAQATAFRRALSGMVPA